VSQDPGRPFVRPAHAAAAGQAIVYLSLATPLLIRLNAIGRYGGVDGVSAYLQLIGWELPILLFLGALHEYGRRLRSGFARVPVRLLVIGLWAVLLLDALIFRLFGLRLAFPDVIRYGTSLGEIVAFVDVRIIAAAAFAVGLLLVIGNGRPGDRGEDRARTRVQGSQDPARGWRRPRLSRRAVFPVVALVGLLMGSMLTPRDDGDLYGWRLQNWLSLNTQNSLYRSYTPPFLDSIRAELPLSAACDAVELSATRPDVLIVLLESFSSGFSPMYGGSQDAHPELERISLEGLRFTRFLANGFTTEHGLIAILGGRMPLFPAEVAPFSLTGNTAFAGHYGLTTSLPACADSLGYHTEFLTAGDLSFTNKGNWLRSIGFARVEGHDAPYYDGLPRHVFQAVSDSALYARVLHRFDELRAGSDPFLLVVEGVESHGPYRGTDGMLAALRSADASLGRLYDQLVESGFLETGLVLLVSDHRVQRALTAEERASFGHEAAVRVPAVLLGRGVIPGADSLPRHQLDVLPTLLPHMGGRTGALDLANAMTAHAGPRCIPWLHGGRRDEIGALCDGEYLRIRLDAERTRVVQGIPTDESDYLIAAIHRARVDGADPERQSGSHVSKLVFPDTAGVRTWQ
jgi:lipoteichoic acid synthase